MTELLDDAAPLGARIRAGRTALGLTQAALAAAVGCSTEMLRKFEAGAKRPSASLSERLADRFGLSDAARASFLAASRSAPAAAPTPWFPRTKLHPPRPRDDLLLRPRLIGRLRDALPRARLILVAAPAGSGKTTLLSEAVAALALPCAWVALDGDDNDPVRFFAVLLAACAQLAPDLPSRAAPLFQALAEPQPDRTVPVRQAVAVLVNGLFELPPAGGLLVLDDLHVVGEPLIYAALEYLIAQLPAGLTLLIATRHDPPLALGRLRARRELLELSLPELRFTATESAELLTDRLGLHLAADELGTLHRRTEGWAAGLSLTAASLAGIESADERAGRIASLAQTDRGLFDYLVEEVLARQTPAVRDFLLDTAVLPELTAACCRAVSGRADAAATLDELYRNNLFLEALAPPQRHAAPITYRYHDLFRAFLLEHLRREDSERLRELHRRAAACAPDPLRAAEHLLQAEQWDEAATTIVALVEVLLASGAQHTVETLINALPAAYVAARPALRMALGRCALQRWDTSAVAVLREAASDFAQAGEVAAWAETLVFLSAALSRAGVLPAARAAAEQALLLPLASSRRVELLADRAWQSLLGGDLSQAVADVDAAITVGERSGDGAALRSLATACTGFLLGLPGALARADRLSRLLAAPTTPAEPWLQASAALTRAWAALWRDDWALAERERGQAWAFLGPEGTFTAIHAELLLQDCLCAALRGDAAAGARCEELLGALEQDGGPRRAWRIALLHGLARVRWLQSSHGQLRELHTRMVAALPARVWPTDTVLVSEIGALAQLTEGNSEAASATLRLVAEDQARLALVPVLGDPRWHLAHAYLQAGQPERAHNVAGPALAAVRREEMPGRLRWQGAGLVAPLLNLRVAGGPNAEFAAAALARLAQHNDGGQQR